MTPSSAATVASAVISIASPRGSTSSAAKSKHEAMLIVAAPKGSRTQRSSPAVHATSQKAKAGSETAVQLFHVAAAARRTVAPTSRDVRIRVVVLKRDSEFSGWGGSATIFAARLPRPRMLAATGSYQPALVSTTLYREKCASAA